MRFKQDMLDTSNNYYGVVTYADIDAKSYAICVRGGGSYAIPLGGVGAHDVHGAIVVDDDKYVHSTILV